MPDLTVEIEVFCATCGAGLCNQSSGGSKRGIPFISVEVCPKCKDDAYKEGYDEGFDSADGR